MNEDAWILSAVQARELNIPNAGPVLVLRSDFEALDAFASLALDDNPAGDELEDGFPRPKRTG